MAAPGINGALFEGKGRILHPQPFQQCRTQVGIGVVHREIELRNLQHERRETRSFILAVVATR
ncbi:hypothetical protein GCM10023213_20430 [Prosthecobacter algae]|uniref:Uncharacterized protein n=1 Tax=Prosthecobacter algae TaxID=1144682 RepID=A0ABP9P7A9_9BACT